MAGVADGATIPEMLSLAGYTYLFLGENYCNGVPISEAPIAGALDLGTPLTNTELFMVAIDRFDAALVNTAGSALMDHLARIGMARALLNLDLRDEAMSTVQSVPDDFAYLVEHSENSSRQNNSVFQFNTILENWSVWDRQGGNGLPFRSANDPRVPWARVPSNDVGADQSTAQFDLLTFNSRSDPVPLARGVEARLIDAEAALRNGDPSWITTLDALRTSSGLDFSGNPPIADQGSFDANVVCCSAKGRSGCSPRDSG